MKDIIEVNGLTKTYGDLVAVNELSFKVKKGELFAFLGENGAGKSTTISILCGLLNKDKGNVLIDSHDIDNELEKIKSEIGIVFQNSYLDNILTVYDNLKSRASLYNINGDEFKKRLNELSEMLNFKDLLKRPLNKLSGGQKRRIDIARALIHKPKILILDEPTTGLDPLTRKNVWEVIKDLMKKDNLTVFLTTHYMEESAEADYVLILDKGKIAAQGTPIELKNNYANDYIILYNTTEEVVKKVSQDYEKISANSYKIKIKDSKEATDLIIANKDIFVDYEIIKGKMDDVFLNVTGSTLKGVNE